ncbi:hypothetical protein LINPERPRIM_LOCUS13484 [Linum perenne]
METTTNKVKVALKLLIEKKSNKVVFAEAGKDFVDFLFSFLSFPVGTLIRLLSKDQMPGCMGNLYQSVEDLDVTFMQPSTSKDSYLKPTLQKLCTTKSNLLSLDGVIGTPSTRNFYKCYKCSTYVTDKFAQTCPNCRGSMSSGLTFMGSDSVKNVNEGEFVKSVICYMVMDDLQVKPLSPISIDTLFNKLNIQQAGSLEEKVVEIGIDEGLNLLKASLQSKTVLTNVFLGA